MSSQLPEKQEAVWPHQAWPVNAVASHLSGAAQLLETQNRPSDGLVTIETVPSDTCPFTADSTLHKLCQKTSVKCFLQDGSLPQCANVQSDTLLVNLHEILQILDFSKLNAVLLVFLP